MATCFYQANKLRINGQGNKFSEVIEDIFYGEYEPSLVIQNQQFEKLMKIVYLSCNDRISIEDLGYETYEFDIKSNLFNGGGLDKLISNKSYGLKQTDKFLIPIFESNKN